MINQKKRRLQREMLITLPCLSMPLLRQASKRDEPEWRVLIRREAPSLIAGKMFKTDLWSEPMTFLEAAKTREKIIRRGRMRPVSVELDYRLAEQFSQKKNSTAELCASSTP